MDRAEQQGGNCHVQMVGFNTDRIAAFQGDPIGRVCQAAVAEAGWLLGKDVAPPDIGAEEPPCGSRMVVGGSGSWLISSICPEGTNGAGSCGRVASLTGMPRSRNVFALEDAPLVVILPEGGTAAAVATGVSWLASATPWTGLDVAAAPDQLPVGGLAWKPVRGGAVSVGGETVPLAGWLLGL